MLDGFGKLVRRICSKLAGQHKADTDPKGMSNNHLCVCVCVFLAGGGGGGSGGERWLHENVLTFGCTGSI